LDTLGAFIGPLYGVLIADYYLVKRRRVDVDALYTLDPNGKYHYKKGYNPIAIIATAVSAIAGMIVVFWGSSEAATYTWFIGAGSAFVIYMVASRMFSVKANYPDPNESEILA
jgi:NCS1 family nucleobase:cation symporter-1